ncbi:site-specific integrase [Clostridium sp. 19966]|uniref:site-specific integrase n=1 Tax=Clostridium sp. 19966 TaxID=2768166 RepID=UPI0028DEEF9E|nr:site-specific integrase [Clostridium sp. 19966]MDT8718888.1 site-specific integrase [Clostridium sp. 19966]
MQGLKIKKFRKVNNINYNLGYTQILKFTEKNVNKYINRFDELKKRKIVLSGGFWDIHWILRGRERKAHLIFNHEFNKKLTLAIKIFLIIKLDEEKVNPRTLIRCLNGIKFVVKNTNCLDLNSIHCFQEALKSHKDSYIINDIINAGNDFLCFYDYIKFKPFREKIRAYNYRKYDSRRIPEFISAILFDTILNEFMSSLNMECKTEREKYLPVLLWWRISSTIPMRPIEFSELETNAAKIINGRYILSILNGKDDVNESGEKERTYRHIDITKDLYDLIQEYISEIDPDRKEKYLFNYNIYAKHTKSFRSFDRFLDAHKDNYAGTERFYALLERFYADVVEKEYGYKTISVENNEGKQNSEDTIERIRPGDTRHFAICNLYLQGVNPLTIARLAGHDNIYTQLTYANHMKTFIKSKVKLIADEIRRRRLLGEGLYSNKRLKELYNKSLFFSVEEQSSARPVEDGYCIDKEYPDNCILGMCKNECDYFRLALSKENDLIYLTAESNNYLNDIDKQVNILKEIIKTSNLNKSKIEKNRCFDIRDQERMGICAKKIQQVIANKAIVDSYIMKTNEVSCIE